MDGVLFRVPSTVVVLTPSLVAAVIIGKFCRSFGLTREHNGLDLTGGTIYLEDHNEQPDKIIKTPRIGVNHGMELPWRFCDAGSDAVSR